MRAFLVAVLLVLAAPAGATHPEACVGYDPGPVPTTRRPVNRCLRQVARLCRFCARYPGLELCHHRDAPGGVCDTHACGVYTSRPEDCPAESVSGQ